MRKIVAVLAATAFATQTVAGSLVFEGEVENEVLAAEETMGGSNASWIIPLIAVGVIALAVSSSGDDDDEEEDSEDDEIISCNDISLSVAEPIPCQR